MKDSRKVKITFFGGVDEIGGNKILLESGDTRIFLDFGMSFAAEGKYFEFPLLQPAHIGDLLKTGVIPDLEGVYRHEHAQACYGPAGVEKVDQLHCRRAVDAVLLSHAHVDHYGYIGLLRQDIPVVTSATTKKLIKLRADVGEDWKVKTDHGLVRGVGSGEAFKIGDFLVRRYDVDHSVLGASSFLIEAEGKSLVYTGDIRFHGSQSDQSEQFLKAVEGEQIDVLLCEGTRISTPRDPDEQEAESNVLASEQEVEERCRALVSAETGLVVYDASPLDLNRICILSKVAGETGRTLVIDSKKAYVLTYLNHGEGAPLCPGLPQPGDFSVYLGRRKLDSRTKKYKGLGVEDLFVEAFAEGRQGHERHLLIQQKKAGYGGQFREKDGDDQLVHLGDETFIWGPLRRKILEEQDRYLIYTSNGPLTLLQLLETEGPKTKGTFIYGKAEPFNEEMEFSFARLRNWLDLCGLKLAYAHTSGHADIQSLKRFVSAADPGLLMPIHTESPESFKGLARKVVLPELGQAHDV